MYNEREAHITRGGPLNTNPIIPPRGVRMASLALLASLGALFIVHTAVANPTSTTIEVTSTDGGTGGPECRLRDAITAANSSSLVGGCDGSGGEPFVIELHSNTEYRLTVIDNNSNGLPVINTDITINGHNSKITRSFVSPTPSFRIFQVASSGFLTLNEVWVINGGKLSEGGGLHNAGKVILIDSYFQDNVADQGAGIYNQAAGKMEITQSRLLSNYGGCGGGIANYGILTMTNTTLIGNFADM